MTIAVCECPHSAANASVNAARDGIPQQRRSCWMFSSADTDHQTHAIRDCVCVCTYAHVSDGIKLS